MCAAAPIVATLLVALSQAARAEPSASDFTKDVLPVLEAHCVKCHGPDKQKGKLRLDTLSSDLANDRRAAETWHDVRDALNLGEMPPDDEPELPSPARQAVLGWINQSLDALHAGDALAPGQVTVRRLNRTEYQNTMRDLLGVDTDYTAGLPPESLSPDGFHNHGDTQLMSDQHLEAYLAAARKGLSKAVVSGPAPEVFAHTFTKSVNDKGRGASLLDEDQQFVAVIKDDYPEQGEFLLRVKARAHLVDGRGFPQLRPAVGYRADVRAPRAFMDPVDVTSEDWQTFEYRGRIEHFPLPSRTQSKFPGLRLWLDNAYAEGRDKPLKPRKKKKPKKGKNNEPPPPEPEPTYPRIEIASLEFTGPVFDDWPPAHHRRILIKTLQSEADEPAYVADVLRHFTARAFRRPTSDGEVAPFLTFFKKSRAAGHDFEPALRETLAMVLVSPEFLYLVEPAAPDAGGALDAWQVASRLSYFLWATMPDDHLFNLARSGELLKPATLQAEVDRMLADPRSENFVAAFTAGWLDTGAVDRVAVNPEFYPDFDNGLKPAMRQESQAFFAHLLREDLAALNLIDSDFAVLNEPLARHYGIPGGPRGTTFEPVALPENSRRGGVLTHAGILLGNSTGEDSHPVKRAVWLRARLLGDPPEDPPPDVPALDEADPDFARLPVREQLRLHRGENACNDCHRGIDPWGIALENFGGDGLWRDTIRRKKTRGKGFVSSPVVTATTLPDGTDIDGVDALKAYLLEHRRDQFAHAFTEKLTTFALGRSLVLGDRKHIDPLTESFAAAGYRIAPLIKDIVTSELFLTK